MPNDGIMGARIPLSTKSQVIQKWMAAIPRDIIAVECGLSGGAVRRSTVGVDLVDQLRDVAKALRKRSLTPVECATALRLISMMNRLGVNDESLEYFISEIYTKGVDIGLDPKLISAYLSELVDFWSAREVRREEELARTERKNIGVNANQERQVYKPFSEILIHISKLREEKTHLESEIYKLRAEVEDLNNKKSKSAHQLEIRLHDDATTAQELKWYSEVKSELRRSGMDLSEVKKFVSAVQWVKENRVNLVQVINLFPSYNLLFHEVVVLKDKIANLELIETETENIIQSNHLKIREIENMKSLNCGLTELKFLHQTLKEIYEAHDLASTQESAMKRFLTDVENDYDSLVGFKSKLNALENNCSKLNEERNRQIARIETIPYIGSTISSLFRKGLTEVDILQIASLLHNYPSFMDIWLSFKSKREKEIAEGDLKSKPESEAPSPGLRESESNKDPASNRDCNNREKQNRIELNRELIPIVPKSENEQDMCEENVLTYLSSLEMKYNPPMQETDETIAHLTDIGEPVQPKLDSKYRKKLRAPIIKRKVSKNHIPQVSRKIQQDDDVNQDKVSSHDISYTTYNSAKDADDATHDSHGITK
jgi:hypothetical protein